MNILNLLTKQKHVAGIEISDSVIRIAFFRPLKKEASTKENEKDTLEDELILIEEPIAANIIADGIVADVDLLSKTLKNIWTKAALETEYAIVAIPDDTIYSRTFSFPKSVNEARITEAMRLAVEFQLPMKTEDVYLDWERTQGESGVNEIFLSTIPKNVVQGYITALEKAGIKTLALESHLSAIARAIELPEGTTTLLLKKTPDGATIFTIKNRVLRFSRTLPLKHVPEDAIQKEVTKVRTAIEAEGVGAVVEQNLLEAHIREEYKNHPEITKPESKWIISLGAAIRGKIPQGEDNLVSLLPIGTEEAYAYQRATTFIVLMRNLIIGVSLFFVLAYFATYLFMMSVAKETTEKITTLTTQSLSPDVLEKEGAIHNVNALTQTGVTLLSQTPTWSPVITEILARTPQGITISMLSAPKFEEKISITGTAISRTVLNSFKSSLQSSSLFTEIELPLSNLEQRENIPFSISFRIKDPSALYYK